MVVNRNRESRIGSTATVLAVDLRRWTYHDSRDCVACRWRTAFKQQGTDNSGGLWFTPWSPTLSTEDGMRRRRIEIVTMLKWCLY